MYILALGSPTHPIAAEAWNAWTSTYTWGEYYGQSHVGFAPLFGHQYSQVWVDFRGIKDAYMRGRGIDYFENSRRATLAQRSYAIANPDGWAGYGADIWGLTASDGPADVTPHGERRCLGGSSPTPPAAPPTPKSATTAPSRRPPRQARCRLRRRSPAPRSWRCGSSTATALFGQYGFLDAFNPTWQWPEVPLQHGRLLPGLGWFDTDYLGIDQGPIVAMIANHRTDLVWRYMRKSPYVIQGLRRAGFTRRLVGRRREGAR